MKAKLPRCKMLQVGIILHVPTPTAVTWKALHFPHRQYLCTLYDSHINSGYFPKEHQSAGLCNGQAVSYLLDTKPRLEL
jgi:hypothetical protein